jgi:hypothetical protein
MKLIEAYQHPYLRDERKIKNVELWREELLCNVWWNQ